MSFNRYLPLRIVTVARLDLYQIYDECSHIVSQCMTRFANCLQQLHLAGNRYDKPCTVFIPVLPKLRVLKVSDFLKNWLQFETQSDQFPLHYGKQFPNLEMLRIIENWTELGDFSDFFEGIVPLLYESFLRERIPRCESLRELEIPLPQRDKFRLYKSRESVGGEEYRWRNSEEYLKRIQNTFPGVDYQVLNPVWKRVQNLW